MMRRIRQYLGWLILLAAVAIPLATTGCATRSRYYDPYNRGGYDPYYAGDYRWHRHGDRHYRAERREHYRDSRKHNRDYRPEPRRWRHGHRDREGR